MLFIQGILNRYFSPESEWFYRCVTQLSCSFPKVGFYKFNIIGSQKPAPRMSRSNKSIIALTAKKLIDILIKEPP